MKLAMKRLDKPNIIFLIIATIAVMAIAIACTQFVSSECDLVEDLDTGQLVLQCDSAELRDCKLEVDEELETSTLTCALIMFHDWPTPEYIMEPTFQPDPTATDVPDPVATSRPNPTSTLRPNPTSTSVVTNQDQSGQTCAELGSGPGCWGYDPPGESEAWHGWDTLASCQANGHYPCSFRHFPL